MDRRFRLAAFITAATVVLSAPMLTGTALAAPKDAAATQIDQEAMNNDFLTADFPKAEGSLKRALTTCGASGCSPKVKAVIFMHLGIVQVNNDKPSEAEGSFVEALKLDSTVAPEKDFTTPEVEKAFEAAKAKAIRAVPPPPRPTPSATAAVANTEPPGEELGMEPVPEQIVSTPVPLFVTVPESMTVRKVIVMYRPFGGSWKKLELKKTRGGWIGSVPCEDVSTTGDLKYYIKALDEGGDNVAGLGSVTKPLVTKIKNELEGEAPHLPDTAPPAACAAKELCPPDFPGCNAGQAQGDKPAGKSCETAEECGAGMACKDGQCAAGEGQSEDSAGPVQRNWVGLYFSQDVSWVMGDNVCGANAQTQGYACFLQRATPSSSAGDQYFGNPIASGRGNAIAGGLSVATTRVMAGYDRVIGSNFALGTRLGLAFRGGGPKPKGGAAFLPYHVEARAAYWFGKDPFQRNGFRPFAYLGGGFAQVDAKVSIQVRERTLPAQPADIDVACTPDAEGNCAYDWGQTVPVAQRVDAWRKAGQGFAAVGAGMLYTVTPNSGVVAEIKVLYMLPASSLVVSPTLGYAVGF